MLNFKPYFLSPHKSKLKNQCPSARGLPEDFETQPTFIPSANFEGVTEVWNISTFFGGHPGFLDWECTGDRHEYHTDGIGERWISIPHPLTHDKL